MGVEYLLFHVGRPRITVSTLISDGYDSGKGTDSFDKKRNDILIRPHSKPLPASLQHLRKPHVPHRKRVRPHRPPHDLRLRGRPVPVEHDPGMNSRLPRAACHRGGQRRARLAPDLGVRLVEEQHRHAVRRREPRQLARQVARDVPLAVQQPLQLLGAVLVGGGFTLREARLDLGRVGEVRGEGRRDRVDDEQARALGREAPGRVQQQREEVREGLRAEVDQALGEILCTCALRWRSGVVVRRLHGPQEHFPEARDGDGGAGVYRDVSISS